MDTLNKLSASGIVPVAVINNAENAVSTAKAIQAGGINVMEITFRNDAAADSIRAVSEHCPEMTVGAGTVLDLDQCKLAVDCGAKFIVSPGFNEDVVSWCIKNGITVTPGCATPTEIMKAINFGLSVVKFFPANVYGGLNAIKSLSGPFPGIKFIPTGGINQNNIGDFIRNPHVFAVGGSWICPKADISEGNTDRISSLCEQARAAMLGYEIAHLGINSGSNGNCSCLCNTFCRAFGFSHIPGNSSDFVTPAMEVMKAGGLGTNGHIGVYTNSIALAAADLQQKGFELAEDTAKYSDGRIKTVYLKNEIGGFAVHLLQK